jgi:hypothetical protein
MVHVVLVKLNLERGVVTLGPLSQPPALDNLFVRLEFEIFTRDIATKQLKLATLVCTFKHLGRAPREGSDARWVDECLVRLLGSRAELLVVCHGRRVHHGASLALRARGLCWLGSGVLLGQGLGGGEAARRVGAGGVLNVLAMFGDESRSELLERLSQLGDDLGSDQVLYGLLLLGLGNDIDLELWRNGQTNMILQGSHSPLTLLAGVRERRWLVQSCYGWCTYDILVLVGIVGDLRDGDGARNLIGIGRRPYALRVSSSCSPLICLGFTGHGNAKQIVKT